MSTGPCLAAGSAVLGCDARMEEACSVGSRPCARSTVRRDYACNGISSLHANYSKSKSSSFSWYLMTLRFTLLVSTQLTKSSIPLVTR